MKISLVSFPLCDHSRHIVPIALFLDAQNTDGPTESNRQPHLLSICSLSTSSVCHVLAHKCFAFLLSHVLRCRPCVLCLLQGSTFGIPGVDKYTHFLRDISNVERIRDHLLENWQLSNIPGGWAGVCYKWGP
jgi:hypothetical protein